MAKKCAICDKKPVSGHNVSHANNKTKKRIKPNLKRQRVNINGTVKQVWVCTSCIRSGKVKKA